MLFANLPSLPSTGPVKFRNQTGPIEQTDLIDPIFITVQSKKRASVSKPRDSTAARTRSGVSAANGCSDSVNHPTRHSG